MVLLLLLVELLDEFTFGAREAAWPLIRDDLTLTYTQVGLLLGLPGVLGVFTEPALAVLSDSHRRKAIILGGGTAFAVGSALVAAGTGFWALLAAFIILYPASGAFVSISQAALMDLAPARREQNMARWAFAGSLGLVAGTAVIGLATQFGGGWRPVFAVCGGLAAALVFFGRTMPLSGLRHTGPAPEGGLAASLKEGAREVVTALRRREVLRWLALLQMSDLMLDVLLGFLALYLVDAGKATPAQAALGVGLWTGFGLVSDFLIIPLLERVPGLSYLKVSVFAAAVLFPSFLLAEPLWAKLVLAAALGVSNAGMYAVLQAQLYRQLPGASGAAVAVSSVAGLTGGLIPLGIGVAASTWGIGAAMWLLLAGPAALIIGLPRRIPRQGGPDGGGAQPQDRAGTRD